MKVRVERSVGGAADPQERSEVNSKLPRYLNPVGLRFVIYQLESRPVEINMMKI